MRHVRLLDTALVLGGLVMSAVATPVAAASITRPDDAPNGICTATP